MTEVKAIVCGGREYSDYGMMFKALSYARENMGLTHVIHGAARGADSLSGRAAHELGLQVTEVPAQWDQYGKSAGYRRNTQMAEMAPDFVIAFPGGRGTQHMIDIAESKGITVYVVPS